MSTHKRTDGCIELSYGYDEKTNQYFYKIVDLNRKHINNGIVDHGGSKTTGLTPIIMAEKLKKFGAPKEHIQRVLYMKKI